MWEKFESWLIKSSKISYTSFSRKEDLGALLFFITTLFILFFLELLSNNLASQALCILTEAILLGSLILIMNNHTLGLNPAIGCWLHHMIRYNKNYRQERIDEFVRSYEHDKNTLIEKETFIGLGKFKEINKEDLGSWIRQYIGKQPSLINLIGDRVLGTKEFRSGILFWSQMIPKCNIKIDDFKLLLLICPVKNKDNLINLDSIQQKDVDFAFRSYHDHEIKRIFTSAFQLKHYIEILNISKKHNLELIVKKDMQELFFWAKECSAAITGEQFSFKRPFNWIDELENACSPLGEIIYIDNLAKLDYWATAMNNCLKGQKFYSLRSESFLFGVYRNGKPHIVFQVNHMGHLREAKKRANEALHAYENTALIDLLNEVLKRPT